MLKKLVWKEGQGLGKEGTGMAEPPKQKASLTPYPTPDTSVMIIDVDNTTMYCLSIEHTERESQGSIL